MTKLSARISALSTLALIALTAACGVSDGEEDKGTDPTPPNQCTVRCDDGGGSGPDQVVDGNDGDDTNSPDVIINIDNNATAGGRDANSGDTNTDVDGNDNDVDTSGGPSGNGGGTDTATDTDTDNSCNSCNPDPDPEPTGTLPAPFVSWDACDDNACSCTLGFYGDAGLYVQDDDSVTAIFHDGKNPGTPMLGSFTSSTKNNEGYTTLVFMAEDVNAGTYRITFQGSGQGDDWAQYGNDSGRFSRMDGTDWLYSAELEDGIDNVPYYDGRTKLVVWTNSDGQKACRWESAGNVNQYLGL